MKKKYIQPKVSVSFVVVESQLLAGSETGAQKEQNDDFFESWIIHFIIFDS